MATKKTIKFTDITSFEIAREVTGRPEVPAFADVPEDLRPYHKKQYMASVITEAINGKWKADWKDRNQKKWIPWFLIDTMAPSGFAFSDTYWNDAGAHAGDASRLCFESEAKADHAGRTFTGIFAGIITE